MSEYRSTALCYSTALCSQANLGPDVSGHLDIWLKPKAKARTTSRVSGNKIGGFNGMMDNPLFGLNGWQKAWDGDDEEYTLGQNLGEGEHKDLLGNVAEHTVGGKK